jgi:acetyl esterase/lipase
VKVEGRTIAGVRCDVITPLTKTTEKRNRLLINVHGDGFVSDSGSLVEGIPIANLTETTVISVYYRPAPEYPFPAAVEDAVAVYRELLKGHKPKEVGLFRHLGGRHSHCGSCRGFAAARPAPSCRARHLFRNRGSEPAG